jgi:hypothetical protein
MGSRYWSRIVVAGLLLFSANGKAAEPTAKAAKQVQTDVKLLRESVYRPLTKAEIETAIKLLHPKMIEEVGGALKARANAESEARRAATSLFQIEKVEFPEAPRFLAGSEHEFVIVPVKLTLLRADKLRDVSQWFYLGGRKKGATAWIYVDVPRLSMQGPAAFFSDFPADVTLPRTSRRQIRPGR